MDNQHKKITGYRDLTQEEINLMNEVKRLGSELENLITELSRRNDTDKRWVAIGKSDLQKGLMSLTRSVAKPTCF